MQEIDKIKESVDFINNVVATRPKIGIILGSGLGELADEVENSHKLGFTDIPHLPPSTVPGHSGEFVTGKLQRTDVVVMRGRYHYYEGYDLVEVVRPVRIMGLLGIDVLLVTNAAGALNRNFSPGNLMLISDHVNMIGANPLRGPNIDELGPRFPDMTYTYDRELIGIAEEVMKKEGVIGRKGVYASYAGPSFETPAEIRMLERLGVDAVGMSTVPEVITARHMEIRVLGISCITNMAAGFLQQRLSHDEVMEIGQSVKPVFKKVIKGIVQALK